VDTSKLPVHKKHVRPINLQDAMESRRLWYHVTESLQHDDTDKATEHKRIVSWSSFLLTWCYAPFLQTWFNQIFWYRYQNFIVCACFIVVLLVSVFHIVSEVFLQSLMSLVSS